MTIKIWLGDLAAYNDGRLVGEWLSLPMDEEELLAKYNKYTNDGQTDHFIADYESDFKVSEYGDPFKLNTLAETLESMGDYDLPKLAFLIDYQGYSLDDALEKYEDVDYYPDMTLKGLAEQFVDEGIFGDIPETIQNYIDYDAIARDLAHDYVQTDAGCFRHD